MLEFSADSLAGSVSFAHDTQPLHALDAETRDAPPRDRARAAGGHTRAQPAPHVIECPGSQRGASIGAVKGGSAALVMTLVVRDEADVIDAHVAFHLNAGVHLVAPLRSSKQVERKASVYRASEDSRFHNTHRQLHDARRLRRLGPRGAS